MSLDHFFICNFFKLQTKKLTIGNTGDIIKENSLGKVERMDKISEYVSFESGTPQFRINESTDDNASVYSIYSQNDLLDDLTGIKSSEEEPKKIRTRDEVSVLFSQDIIFSLISGTASIVRNNHHGYLYTQNYIKIKPGKNMDSQYMVYLLNQNKTIRRQFQLGLQGTSILKYTLAQLKKIELPSLPLLYEQKIIGEIYFKQLRLQALRRRVADYKTIVLLNKLERMLDDERSTI